MNTTSNIVSINKRNEQIMLDFVNRYNPIYFYETIDDLKDTNHILLSQDYSTGEALYFPPNLFKTLNHLESIMMFHDDIVELPQDFYNLKSLASLRLGGVRLKYLSESMSNLKQLTSLLLIKLPIKKIPTCIKSLPNLTNMNFANLYHIEKYPVLNNVDYMSFHGCEFKKFPNVFSNKKMKTLAFRFCNFTQLPAEIKKLKKLHSLEITNNQLEKLNENIRFLTNLIELNLNTNCLTQLPQGIKALKNLEKLDLHENQLTHLPDEIDQLIKLRELNITDNLIEKLPTSLTRLNQLEKFEFDFSLITSSSYKDHNIEILRQLFAKNPQIKFHDFDESVNRDNPEEYDDGYFEKKRNYTLLKELNLVSPNVTKVYFQQHNQEVIDLSMYL